MTGQPDLQGGGAVPVCPRHPSVVSYVRCSRCERPTCPQCQRQAAVGVQCVDCVRDGARTTRQATGRFGGAVQTGGAPVTLTIIALCVVVYVLQTVSPGVGNDIAFMPALGEAQPWRFLTAAFAHASPTHILFNMLALWQVGVGLERVFGRWRYLALYLVAALAGSVGYLLLAAPPASIDDMAGSNWFQATVGASGAVFGLFGAYLVVARKLGLDMRGMLILLGVNALLGFTVPGIAWQAHLGGFVAGIVTAGILVGLGGRERRRLQWPAIGTFVLLLVLVSVLKYLGVDPSMLPHP